MLLIGDDLLVKQLEAEKELKVSEVLDLKNYTVSDTPLTLQANQHSRQGQPTPPKPQ